MSKSYLTAASIASLNGPGMRTISAGTSASWPRPFLTFHDFGFELSKRSRSSPSRMLICKHWSVKWAYGHCPYLCRFVISQCPARQFLFHGTRSVVNRDSLGCRRPKPVHFGLPLSHGCDHVLKCVHVLVGVCLLFVNHIPAFLVKVCRHL